MALARISPVSMRAVLTSVAFIVLAKSTHDLSFVPAKRESTVEAEIS